MKATPAAMEMDKGVPAKKPVRKDLPKVRPYTKGSIAKVREVEANPELLRQMVAEFEGAKFANSDPGSHKSRWGWWLERARVAQIEPLPATVNKLWLMGSLLKAGGYRSAGQYYQAFKRSHVEEGMEWTSQLELAQKDSVRACSRGIGPPKKAEAFDLTLVAKMAQVEEPLVEGGPLGAKDLVLIASWWAMREIELAAIELWQVEFEEDGSKCGKCTINLPTDKTDPKAVGKLRRHGCCCTATSPWGKGACPVAAARRAWMRSG